jgi:hypothetical protein
MGPAGPAGPPAQLSLFSNLFISGPAVGAAVASQGPFACPTGSIGTGLQVRVYAGSVAVAIRCNQVGFTVVDGVGTTAVLSNPTLTSFLGSSYAVANSTATTDLACPSSNALVGIQYTDNQFQSIDLFAGVCQSMVSNGNTTVTAAAGLGFPGTTRVVACPAGKIVTGIEGQVDSNESPVQVSAGCS